MHNIWPSIKEGAQTIQGGAMFWLLADAFVAFGMGAPLAASRPTPLGKTARRLWLVLLQRRFILTPHAPRAPKVGRFGHSSRPAALRGIAPSPHAL